MERISSTPDRELFLRVMAPGEELGDSFDGDPYPALVWAAAETVEAQKHRLCAELIATGCRYIVCGGHDATAWEEAADEAFAAQDLPDAEFDARHVMTTSHEGEPPGEVARFFVHDTRFGGHDFRHYLVLVIGEDAGMREQLADAVREAAEHG